jgi:shikimate kinase
MSGATDIESSPRLERCEPELVRALAGRSIVLVGMMGAGKTSVGRRLAQRLALPFVDADVEIERAASATIPEIFARDGEPFFRDREHHVVVRLLRDGQKVLATGGGAFMLPGTRDEIRARGFSVWLKADLDVLLRRVRKRSNRPLLANNDQEGTLRRLMEQRYPVYAEADCTVVSQEGPHEAVVDAVIAAIKAELAVRPQHVASGQVQDLS